MTTLVPFYFKLLENLTDKPKTWLVTGVAGFIGSNLLEALLKLDQRVVGLDNFASGSQRNLDEVQTLVTQSQWNGFNFIEGDIRNLNDCCRAMTFLPAVNVQNTASLNTYPVDYVLHQAALGSVPRSLQDPIATNSANITGFLNMLVAARDAKVKSFTYAASSSTYGDHIALPKVEDVIGKPLSPYAVTKYVNELYADVFARSYGFAAIGLRYFNVFGSRQDPSSAYAAVVPKWISALLLNEAVYINGDGSTSRDFCYVANAIQANLLAATTESIDARNQIYNIAVGDRTSLNTLFLLLRDSLDVDLKLGGVLPVYRDFRAGDVRHSQADISKARRLLNYAPTHQVEAGIKETVSWYLRNVDGRTSNTTKNT